MRFLLSLLALGGATFCSGQAQSAAGYSAPWDVKRLMDALAAEAGRLKPIVDQADPQQWSDKSAAETYAAQWKSARNLIQYFTGATEKLANNPEKLPVVLETYFRMEAMETSLESLGEGIQRHYNPAVADLLRAVLTENSNNREKLKQYLTDLATAKEQEFQIADREAQRCRSTVNRQAPPPAARTRRQD